MSYSSQGGTGGPAPQLASNSSSIASGAPTRSSFIEHADIHSAEVSSD